MEIPYLCPQLPVSQLFIAGRTKGISAVSLSQAQILFDIADLAYCFKDRMVEE